jgi:hypothetical protein
MGFLPNLKPRFFCYKKYRLRNLGDIYIKGGEVFLHILGIL